MIVPLKFRCGPNTRDVEVELEIDEPEKAMEEAAANCRRRGAEGQDGHLPGLPAGVLACSDCLRIGFHNYAISSLYSYGRAMAKVDYNPSFAGKPEPRFENQARVLKLIEEFVDEQETNADQPTTAERPHGIPARVHSATGSAPRVLGSQAHEEDKLDLLRTVLVEARNLLGRTGDENPVADFRQALGKRLREWTQTGARPERTRDEEVLHIAELIETNGLP
jgi:hypothetical protein